jgi:hypothetical protein
MSAKNIVEGPYISFCRSAFHCEVYARPEVPKQRGELTKKDMLAMALQMYERLKQSEEIEGKAPEGDHLHAEYNDP